MNWLGSVKTMVGSLRLDSVSVGGGCRKYHLGRAKLPLRPLPQESLWFLDEPIFVR